MTAWGIGICLVLAALGLRLVPDLVADDRHSRQVVIGDSDGKVRSGLLTELVSGQLTLGPLTQGNAERVRLKTKNLVWLKFKDRTSTLAPNDSLVLLAGGDVMALRPELVDDESLRARWVRFEKWPAVRVPLEAVRGLLLNRPAGAAASARLFNQVLDYSDSQDAVILNNGDTLQGESTVLNEKELVLQTPQAKSAIDRSGIRAIIFNPTLTSSEPLKGEGALVALVDGSRFRAHDLKLGALDRLYLRPMFGGELEIPLASVESLRFLGGCATYLSDLAPADYKFEPFLDLEWPLRRDQNVSGGFLTLRGVAFAKGLGVHSRSTVTYRLDGKFRRFQATIGIDDETAGKGSAVFEVLLDGKTVYKSGVLTGISDAVAIERVDITGAKTLSLRVDYADAGDIQDRADWCDALLVK